MHSSSFFKNGNLTRSGLYTYGINIIKTKKPKYVMIENVKNLIGKKFINDFYSIINELSEIGYSCYYPKNDKNKPKCLNAKDFGVPQNRERIFVICIRNDVDTCDFEFPIGKDYGIRLKDVLEDKVDEKYYLSDKIQNRFKFNGNEDFEHNETKILAMRGRYNENGTTEQQFEVRRDNNTNTITTVQKDNLLLEPQYRIRKLTPLECLKLMGFDEKDYYKIKEVGISDGQIYKMAGNSIVVNVLEAIFKNLFKDK